MKVRHVAAAALAAAVGSTVLGGCHNGPDGLRAPAATAPAPFAGHGSVEEAYIEGVPPGDRVVLASPSGTVAGEGTADAMGSLIIRGLRPGGGYSFRVLEGTRVLGTRTFRVLSGNQPPPQSFYARQHLHEGLNYLTMRDGVQLAATVRLPPGKTLAQGPFPTVIEYSGYAIAAPHSLIAAELGGGNLADPLLPDTATAVGSVIAPLLGFATVSLQMRGTGCSGGAFDLFGLPTVYDGYDAVEIVAAQPWVAHHRVGMVGISFSGISQLFVAGTRPPHLAAIAPMSVTNDLYATGYPGGIPNSGFAAGWIAQRMADAQPAPAGGEAYARALIAAGDTRCAANQKLRLETPNIVELMAGNAYRTPALFDERSPTTWARHIDVPVFLVGAFQDEQTGGQWPDIVPALARDRDVWVTMINGTHADSLGPAIITRWIEFLHLFVADDLPSAPPLVLAAAPLLYRQLTGAPAEPLPPLRFTQAPSVTAARAAFRRDPRVRILLDNGGGSLGPGAMQPTWEADFSSWPPPQLVPTTFLLAPGGILDPGGTTLPGATVVFHPDPSARPPTDLPTGNPWAALPPYDWTPVTGTTGLGFVSAPLVHDLVVIGPASLDLQLESSAPDTDLQATISEVRPDGTELFVQSGTLRASDRTLDRARSSAVEPVPTYLAADAAPLPAGRFSEVRIPILPFAYAFRAGSRIRITISAPGGDRPAWSFATPATGGKVADTVSMGGVQPSALVLAVIPGIVPGDGQPPCPSLRGQPCRRYVPAGNGG